MTAQIEIELGWMRNSNVDRCARRNITRLSTLLLLVGAEQPSVMTFLHNNESDSRTVVGFEFDARFANRGQFVL